MMEVTMRRFIFLAFIAHAQFLAIGKYNFGDACEVRPILRHSIHRDGDLVTGLERLGSDAEIDQRRWSIPLADPVDDVAFLIFGVELEEAMRIGPTPLCDRALDGDGSGVVRGVAVMCK